MPEKRLPELTIEEALTSLMIEPAGRDPAAPCAAHQRPREDPDGWYGRPPASAAHISSDHGPRIRNVSLAADPVLACKRCARHPGCPMN